MKYSHDGALTKSIINMYFCPTDLVQARNHVENTKLSCILDCIFTYVLLLKLQSHISAGLQ